MPDTLEVATQELLTDLADLTAAEFAAMWNGLGSWNRPDVARLAGQASPLLTATAETAALAQAALAAYLADTPPVPIDTGRIAADVIAGIDTPFTASWHALSEGRPWVEAIDVGRSAAEAFGRDASYQSARDAMVAVQDAGTSWHRYRRVVSAGACPWCQQFRGIEFDSADAASFGHERCDCLVAPVTIAAPQERETAAEKTQRRNAEKAVSLRKQIREADQRQEAARVEQLTESDPARKERLSQREQQWETKAERLREQLARITS